MSEKPANAVAGGLLLPYASGRLKLEWRPHPWWLKGLVVSLGLAVMMVYALGLGPFFGAIDYTRKIPLSEAAGYSWKTGFGAIFGLEQMVPWALFVPAAAMGMLGFLFLRGYRWQWAMLGVNVALPCLWTYVFLLPLFAIVGPPTVLRALLGDCDGEDWSEGFVSWSAAGTWTTMWVLVAAVVWVRQWRRIVLTRAGQAT